MKGEISLIFFIDLGIILLLHLSLIKRAQPIIKVVFIRQFAFLELISLGSIKFYDKI